MGGGCSVTFQHDVCENVASSVCARSTLQTSHCFPYQEDSDSTFNPAAVQQMGQQQIIQAQVAQAAAQVHVVAQQMAPMVGSVGSVASNGTFNPAAVQRVLAQYGTGRMGRGARDGVGRVGTVKLLVYVTPHEAAPATMARPRRRSSGELADRSMVPDRSMVLIQGFGNGRAGERVW
jgi:hypothetical protein